MARKIETLQALYVEELRDLYNAENQLAKAMSEMAQAVQSDDLKEAFHTEASEAQQHAQRISQLCSSLKADPAGHPCKGMEGLLQEGRDLIQNGVQSPVLDAGLIATAQKAQHYEIAGYGCASTFARILGRRDGETLLHQTMEEEKRADASFTRVANRVINVTAANSA